MSLNYPRVVRSQSDNAEDPAWVSLLAGCRGFLYGSVEVTSISFLQL